MTILTIRTWGDPVLKKPTQEITKVTPEIKRLAADMLETMRVEKGVGLAANQVGASWRLFVAEIAPVNGPAKQYILVNPRISHLSPKRETQEEGCLSFPGIYGQVERAIEAEITGVDLEGMTQTLRGSGLLARAFQHEMDHLDGMVFIERMSMVQRVVLNRQLKELARRTQAGLSGRGPARL